ncbi:MAG: hypothetical protein JW699_05345, partial [Chitinispirillaceae bacterium]|nr:hypothetical protein [Chitinispirillaceae bacterium]
MSRPHASCFNSRVTDGVSDGMRRSVLIAVAVIFFWCFGSHGFNHPEIRWSTMETEHFLVHFYDNTAPLAAPAAAIAEEIYVPCVKLYGNFECGKTDIVLADYDDVSNGFADWLGGGVWIWTPDMVMPFRSVNTWLRNVLTHELTHIFSLRRNDGMQLVGLDLNVGIVCPGYTVEAGKTLPAMKLLPMWFAEGLAQSGSYRCGNDCWDSRRDMILRCAVLDKKELTLGQMGVFTHDQLGNELVYNQGFSLTMHIERSAGKEQVKRVLRAAGSRPMDLLAAFSPYPGSKFGQQPIEHYYREWRDSVLDAARRKLPAQLTPAECVFSRGRLNQRPLFSPDNGRWGCLTGNKDDYYRTDLVLAPAGSAGPSQVLKHAESSWDFSPDGRHVYFIKSYYPGEHGSYFKELYCCDVEKGRVKRLTRGGRIYAVAASPSGSEAAVVTFREGRFRLEIIDLRTLAFSTLDEGAPGEPFVSLDFNPGDPSKIVVERLVKGVPALFVYDRSAKTATRITNSGAHEESPHWADNGKVYFSADYDGIFNVYSIMPDGSGLERHTSVAGGAFEPAVDKAGRRLLFSEYTSSGFRISGAEVNGAPYTVPAERHCVFSGLTSFSGQTLEPVPYRRHMLRAAWESLLYMDIFTEEDAQGFSAEAALIRYQNDALQRFYFLAGVDVAGAAGSFSSDTAGLAGHYFRPLAASSPLRVSRFSRFLDSAASMPHTRAQRMKRKAFLPENGLSGGGGLHASAAPMDAFVQETPLVGIASTALAPSIQSVCQLSFVTFIPAFLSSESEIAWQTGRSSHIGVSCFADVMLGQLILSSRIAESDKVAAAGAAFRLWARWQDFGYVNEDIGHNMNGLWEALLECAPSFMQGGAIDSGGSVDYRKVVRGFSGRAGYFRGFPLTRYSGIPFEAEAVCAWYASPVHRTLIDTFGIDGNSDLYCNAHLSAAYSFPIFRNVNSGTRLFRDALYGKA